MKPKNPNFQERVQDIFLKAAFIQDLGIQLKTLPSRAGEAGCQGHGDPRRGEEEV